MKRTIQALDLADLVSGDGRRKRNFVNDLGNNYEEVGFAAMKNHGIPQDLVDAYYGEVCKFFSLNDVIKRKYEIPELAGLRGYTSFGKEHAKHSNVGDLKEFWQTGREVTDDDPIKNEYPDNVYVTELPEFNRLGGELYLAFEAVGAQLLGAIAIYLGLEEVYFAGKIKNGDSYLRAIHYPPINGEPPTGALRAGQHEDINLITLLVGASAEGLQALIADGEWAPVTIESDQIVVNVGDMLQRLTNNKLRSTTHRVVNPPRALRHTSRLSIAFFLQPRSDMSLACLDSCITAGNPRKYEDCTAGDYLDERLVEIGLKKK
jgi:isopenicillin N synthase-like dioxygenase